MELSWDASDCKSKQQGGNCEPETCHLSSTGRKYVLARDQSFVTLSGKDPAQMKVLMSLANRAMLVLVGVFFFLDSVLRPFQAFSLISRRINY